jgi:hypothetical protein
MSFTDEQIAQIAHEAGRELSLVLGDEPDGSWTGLDPDVQKQEATLAQAARYGATPEAIHEKRMESDSNLQPFDQLPPGARAYDYLFAGICAAMSTASDIKTRAENDQLALAEAANQLTRLGEANQPFGGATAVPIQAPQSPERSAPSGEL